MRHVYEGASPHVGGPESLSHWRHLLHPKRGLHGWPLVLRRAVLRGWAAFQRVEGRYNPRARPLPFPRKGSINGAVG